MAETGGVSRQHARLNYSAGQWTVTDLNSTNYGQPANHPLQLDETGKRFCIAVSGSQPCARTIDFMTEMYRINNVNADTVRTPQSVVYNTPNANDLRNIFQAQIWPNQYYNSLARSRPGTRWS